MLDAFVFVYPDLTYQITRHLAETDLIRMTWACSTFRKWIYSHIIMELGPNRGLFIGELQIDKLPSQGVSQYRGIYLATPFMISSKNIKLGSWTIELPASIKHILDMIDYLFEW